VANHRHDRRAIGHLRARTHRGVQNRLKNGKALNLETGSGAIIHVAQTLHAIPHNRRHLNDR
jgi:hypothetical protein